MMFQNKLSAGDENQSVLFPGRTALLSSTIKLHSNYASMMTHPNHRRWCCRNHRSCGNIWYPSNYQLGETNLIGSKLSSRLETKLPKATRLNRSSINPWNDSRIRRGRTSY